MLVDRLWPRGISKEHAALDGWHMDVAPIPTLRKWFNHEEAKFAEFRERYLIELEQNKHPALDLLEDAKGESTLLLSYGAKRSTCNH